MTPPSAHRAPIRTLAVGIALTLAAASAVAQQGYPRKPILMVVPLQAASAVDNGARLVAQKMSENMGVQIVVENQPGAAGVIGTERVARAAPDGYTIGGFNDSILTMLPNMHQKLSWDVTRDFDPVSLVASIEWGLVVPPASPYKTAADVIADAKARPGKLNFSSGGNGSPQHVAMEVFRSRAGVEMVHVPYKGASAAALDVATGQIDVHLSGLPTVAALIRGGKVRLIGVASPQRSAVFPDAPTVGETGLPGFEFQSFFAMMVPTGTPKDIVARLNEEVRKAVADPQVREKLVAQGFTVRGTSPEELGRIARDQLERYRTLFRQANIRAD